MDRDTLQDQSQRLPGWLVRPICQGKHFNEVRRTLSRLKLHTVCQSALYPNQSEYFSKRTAKESVEMVAGEKPDVFNHNLETIPRLYQEVRPKANCRRSLTILSDVKPLEKEAKKWGFVPSHRRPLSGVLTN